MKIAVAQLNLTIGDLTGNASKILEAAQKAVGEGANLLLTPELSLCGYPPRDLLLNPSFIKAMAAQLQELAAALPPEIAVLVGNAPLNPTAANNGGKSLFNSIALLENGKVQQFFHKRLLPTYDVFDEHRYFEPATVSNYFISGARDPGSSGGWGDSQGSRATGQLKIGVTICEDLWNDEDFWGQRIYASNPIADLAAAQVDLIINLSASPYTLGKQKLREAMLAHAAKRYQIPVIYANQVGGNDDLIFDGCSSAFNRAGELVSRAGYFATDLMMVEFDENQRDLVGGSRLAAAPESADEEMFRALVLGVGDYARKCGFKSAVMGLSGGIDSSLVAAVAAAAFGPENVLGVLMPSPYSSDHSVTDAYVLAANLGIKTQILPIGELMAGYDRALQSVFAGLEPDVTEENLQSRIRGNLLMALANKFGHLLLSTGNKSEMAVGYCTLYGDMNGGLAAIADVPKTRVYSICAWLNAHGAEIFGQNQTIIPPNVLSKAPSAELKPGQVDQDSLPPYDILDDILHRLIEKHQSRAEIEAAGYEPATVARVIKLVKVAEFKRRQAPPGLKVTDRAFGTGWRMPIASLS
ncbi:MAG TPA: NAD+ synthase [Oscillatoriaceae cyanobacterium M33_DOE_052]|uniref:Glutamine-dependent NAD(+) synthetase n=1 Tax=Planktothricoides sp. SpSt-374 TaxID=2282167 RepID=A0A7C3VND5_9CYAN|nr:NAD+ synthase [Oscillatoriaceae cyanobacterium M33_DOE_052]